MKYASDFRRIAREALQGRWGVAVGTAFMATLLGAGIATNGGGSSSSGNSSDHTTVVVEDFLNTFGQQYGTILLLVLILLVVWTIVLLVVNGAAKLGYATFNLNLIDRKHVSFGDLFSQFHRVGTGFCMNFLMGLYMILWTLLFIIPGIIKSYSYAMTPYILAEHPEMSVNEAITESRRMMDGNKWRLFCLILSFIGWALLCALPASIGFSILGGLAARSGDLALLLWALPCTLPTLVGCLFLTAYQEAASAAFYREVSGTEAAPEPALPHWSES